MKRRAVMFSGRLDRMFESSKTWTSFDTKRILRTISSYTLRHQLPKETLERRSDITYIDSETGVMTTKIASPLFPGLLKALQHVLSNIVRFTGCSLVLLRSIPLTLAVPAHFAL